MNLGAQSMAVFQNQENKTEIFFGYLNNIKFNHLVSKIGLEVTPQFDIFGTFILLWSITAKTAITMPK